jgi:hypothetical protein
MTSFKRNQLKYAVIKPATEYSSQRIGTSALEKGSVKENGALSQVTIGEAW